MLPATALLINEYRFTHPLNAIPIVMKQEPNENISPQAIVNDMLQQDLFSQWLGITIVKIEKGYCQLQMTVRKEMCNGFGIAHGGIAFSLADSALAFASNTHGRKAISIETSISHIKPIKTGDSIIATTIEKHMGNKIGVYEVSITKNDNTLVALFKGTVYRTTEQWTV